MDDPDAIPGEPAAALEWLRRRLDVQRVTLRLEAADEVYPVRAEALAPGTASLLVPPPGLDMARQPVAHRLLAGERQIVQDDCAAASDDPEFRAMLGLFGGLAAQIVTALRRPDGGLAGMVSAHDLRGPRRWSAAEAGAARRVADALAEGLPR